jgi:ribokinase
VLQSPAYYSMTSSARQDAAAVASHFPKPSLTMPKVFVAGSINMDVVATAARYPRIGETVAGQDVFFFPGGKGANQAVAAAKLGADTTLIGRIGADSFGQDVGVFLGAQGLDLKHVREVADVHTGTALITVADSNNAIVVVPGANLLVSEADVRSPALSRGDILVSQFEIPIATVHAFFARARPAGATTILNPAPAVEFNRGLLELVDVLILNETELSVLTGRDIRSDDPASRIGDAARSLRANGDQVICVTLGQRGAVALVRENVNTHVSHSVNAIDTTGAGDCFVGAVAAQLAAKAPIEDAINYANLAASICVQRMGAGPSMPTKSEVSEKMKTVRA